MNTKMSLRKTQWWLAAISALGLVVAAVTGVRSSNRLAQVDQMPKESERGCSALSEMMASIATVSPEERAREAARIRAARKAAKNAYRASVTTEYEAFKRRVSERASAFDVVRAGIPATVGKYDFGKCWDLMKALAADKIAEMTGEDKRTNFDELMNADLRVGFYQPLQDARGEVLVLLNEFQTRLLACRDEFDRSLSDIPDWDRRLGEAPASLRAESLQIEEMLGALREAQIGASVSAALDAACLVGVCQAVGRLLAGATARFVAGAAAGTTTAMLDSPAPGPADVVGLCIFGIGAGATAWEVRKATKVIPEKLSNALREMVDVQAAEVQRRTLDEGEKLCLWHLRKAAFSGGASLGAEQMQ